MSIFDMTWNQYKAIGKHVASYIAGGITFAVAFHFLSPQQATDINANLNDIYNGFEQMMRGLAGLVAVLTPIYTAWRSAHNASPTQKAVSLTTELPGTKVITTPAIANATPQSPNIMSATEVKVVPK